ncbi:thiol-disulfide oxidoreductase ResA [Bacillus alkalicellulosilyticus]|uniref:thiol-disulfide oxidoreductase ResA n=1 Tax=Alkalihalobacterium alkalicellulosilyticum TaxID=1912214 RepID=UPI0009963DAE|nr:thiol-disulfide oxidoreductase ResA [Bacillus alkalicellulosilyticus]
MKRKRLITRTVILSFLLLAIGYTFYFSFFNERNSIQIGAKSINFVLEDIDGQLVELNEYKGKGVFLNFWGTFCPECVTEMPIMEQLYQEYSDKGIELIAINAGETKLSVQRFVERMNLSFPVVIDTGKGIYDAYGINPLPTTVLINEYGDIVDVYTGPLTEEITREFLEQIKPAEYN